MDNRLVPVCFLSLSVLLEHFHDLKSRSTPVGHVDVWTHECVVGCALAQRALDFGAIDVDPAIEV